VRPRRRLRCSRCSRLRDIRWRLRSPAAAAALAAAAIAVAVVAGAIALRDERQTTPPTASKVVAQLDLAEDPHELVEAFGSVWIADWRAGRVVRVDPVSRHVLARIEVGGSRGFGMQAVGDQIWVAMPQASKVLRIDPATNAVASRFTVRSADRGFTAGVVATDGRVVWLLDFEAAVRVDPRTGATVAEADPRVARQSTWFELSDGLLWSVGRDGRLRALDGRGRVVRVLRPQLPGGQIALLGAPPDLLVGSGGSIARVNARSGHIDWATAVGAKVNYAILGDRVAWVHASPLGGRDLLAAISLDTGERVESIALPVFGANGMALVGGEIWIDTPGGRTLVVRP
jgi:streptogramin lyase